MEPEDLADALDSLNITGTNRTNMLADPDRATGWIIWLRDQPGVTSPAGLLVAKFKTGDWAPDPNAWRGGTATGAPDYAKALKCCEALVRHTGHEYLPEDLEAELRRVCEHPKIGNGATLTELDRRRLLNDAARMRDRQPARDEDADIAQAVRYYVDLVRRGVVTSDGMRKAAGRDPSVWPRICQATDAIVNRSSGEAAA